MKLFSAAPASFFSVACCVQSAAAAAGGLVVAFEIPLRAQAPGTGGTAANALKFNAYVKVSPDDTVTFEIHKAEMGQGTVTSLSQILADEMDADWKKIRTEFPNVDPAYGPMMGVYGSLSIRTSYQPLRVAGAQAREMLISAAAQKWSVDRSTLRTENGAVVNARGGEHDVRGPLALKKFPDGGAVA